MGNRRWLIAQAGRPAGQTAPDLPGGFIYGLAYLPGELEDGRQQQIVSHDLRQPEKAADVSTSPLPCVVSGDTSKAHRSQGLLAFTPVLIKGEWRTQFMYNYIDKERNITCEVSTLSLWYHFQTSLHIILPSVAIKILFSHVSYEITVTGTVELI